MKTEKYGLFKQKEKAFLESGDYSKIANILENSIITITPGIINQNSSVYGQHLKTLADALYSKEDAGKKSIDTIDSLWGLLQFGREHSQVDMNDGGKTADLQSALVRAATKLKDGVAAAGGDLKLIIRATLRAGEDIEDAAALAAKTAKKDSPVMKHIGDDVSKMLSTLVKTFIQIFYDNAGKPGKMPATAPAALTLMDKLTKQDQKKLDAAGETQRQTESDTEEEESKNESGTENSENSTVDSESKKEKKKSVNKKDKKKDKK